MSGYTVVEVDKYGDVIINLDRIEFVRPRNDNVPGSCIQMVSGEQFFTEFTVEHWRIYLGIKHT